jgi:hypothetical protein
VGVGVGVAEAEGVEEAVEVGVAEAEGVVEIDGVAVALAVATATFAPCFHTNFPFEETTVYTYPRHTIFCPTFAAFSVGPAATASDGKRRNIVDNPRPPTNSRRRMTLCIHPFISKK